MDNDEIAVKKCKQMFNEFNIAKALSHKNIIKYLFFLRTYDTETKTHEFHNLMELAEGQDLWTYIRGNGPIKQ